MPFSGFCLALQKVNPVQAAHIHVSGASAGSLTESTVLWQSGHFKCFTFKCRDIQAARQCHLTWHSHWPSLSWDRLSTLRCYEVNSSLCFNTEKLNEFITDIKNLWRDTHCEEFNEFSLQQVLQLRFAQLVLVAFFSRIGVKHGDEALHSCLQVGSHRRSLEMNAWMDKNKWESV